MLFKDLEIGDTFQMDDAGGVSGVMIKSQPTLIGISGFGAPIKATAVFLAYLGKGEAPPLVINSLALVKKVEFINNHDAPIGNLCLPLKELE